MQLTDERWAQLEGGYRRPYDARGVLGRYQAGDVSVWTELWNELHHQGDVGEASYAAVPHLVRIYKSMGRPDWNVYALTAAIEEARHREGNPALPSWLSDDYKSAWRDLETRALSELPAATEDELVSGIFAVLALAKGKRSLARMALLSDEERDEMLNEAGWG